MRGRAYAYPPDPALRGRRARHRARRRGRRRTLGWRWAFLVVGVPGLAARDRSCGGCPSRAAARATETVRDPRSAGRRSTGFGAMLRDVRVATLGADPPIADDRHRRSPPARSPGSASGRPRSSSATPAWAVGGGVGARRRADPGRRPRRDRGRRADHRSDARPRTRARRCSSPGVSQFCGAALLMVTFLPDPAVRACSPVQLVAVALDRRRPGGDPGDDHRGRAGGDPRHHVLDHRLPQRGRAPRSHR